MRNEKNLASITLRIQSGILLLEEISQILQMSPTNSHSKGERMSSRNPSSAIYEQDLWLLEFEEKGSFDELFIEVGNFFERNQKTLLMLTQKCSIDLFCGYFPKESQDSFFIEHATLQKITSVPIDVIFDVYAPSF